MDKVVQRGKIELVVSEISIPTIDSHRKFSWGGGVIKITLLSITGILQRSRGFLERRALPYLALTA